MLLTSFINFPNLKTERLALRQLSLNDEQEILQLRSDPAINKWLNRKKAGTLEDARNFIRLINDRMLQNDSLYWAITYNDNDKMLGTICLFGFSDDHHNCEIGYELLTEFQGRGIMQEAVTAVIEFAFNTIKVENMEACFHKGNQRSINLLEKFSFLQLRNAEDPDPDVICYDLKNSSSKVHDISS